MNPSTPQPISPPPSSSLVPPQTPVLATSATPQAPVVMNSPQVSLPAGQVVSPKIPYRSWVFWLIVLLTANLIVIGYLWLSPMISPPIRIKDQSLEAKIQVDKLAANSNGFLVLRAQLDEPPGLMIAHTSLIIPDTYENFYISIDSDESLPRQLLAQVIPGTVVKATFYKDSDNDGTYNVNIDTEIATGILGNKIQSSFVIKPSL